MNFFGGSKRESREEECTYNSNDLIYELIIKTAIDLLKEKELDQVTFQEICNVSGLVQSQINKYFATKKDLIFGMAYHFLTPKYVVEERGAMLRCTGLEGIEQLFDDKVELMLRYPERYLFMDQFQRYLRSEGYLLQNKQHDQKRYELALMKTEKIWKEYLIAGISDQSIRADLDINLRLQTFSHLVNNFFISAILNTTATTIKDSIYLRDMVHIYKGIMKRYLENS